ncbi:flagellar filament capping protein FliD [Novosphingobium sp. 1949]|uniref:Flagellar hook-associated protein 2 n=1 Tax=Novosphingobium organovorum TaxID=2930092 RepID=A0ABT0BDX2_9SPHN|nr:flagellar filament capping protein FliD [Novosphingobium organovorum]MCJ2183253.1 flagellar filament capping protein FliD [Novosphingobium organovorum]
MTTTSTTATTSLLTTSSLVTALGGGSGIDMTALANNLATATFADRVSRLETKTETLNTKISAASNIKSMMLALDTSLGTLVRSGDLARTPSVANSSVASAALSGSSVPSGSYSLEVTQLATNQMLASNAYTASTDTVGAGTLTLRFGTVSGSSFTEDTSQSAVDITIESGDTLANVAAKINAADAGVTAYVANTAEGAKLVIKGQEGATSGFILEASEDASDPGLSNLAWDPSSANGTLLSTALDAAYKVDGLEYTASSNTVTDIIPGVTLTLSATNVGSPTKVTFSDPSDTIASSMQDFTDALNEIMTELNSATAIGGDLANDSGARSLKRQLAALAGTIVMPNATGTARTLADLGLTTNRDGTFSLDTDRLTATLEADPEGVADMFTNGLYGVYSTVDKIYRSAVSTTNIDSLAYSITKWTSQLDDVADSQTEIAEQQEALRARLASQFTVSETRIGLLNSTKTMLENQIAAWNSSDS